MVKYIGSFVLVYILCCSAYAQDIQTVTATPVAVITGLNEYDGNHSVVLTIDGSSGKSFAWEVIPPEAKENLLVIPNYGAYFSTKEQGTYYFLLVSTETDISVVAIHKWINGTPKPEPDPNPNPNPKPEPEPKPEPKPEPEPIVTTPVPDDYYKDVVANITPLITGANAKVDSVELAKFYMDMADILGRDVKIIKTTEDILKLNKNAGQLMFQQTGIKGRYANLNSEINSAMVKVLTLNNIPLDDPLRFKAVKVVEAIAWACLNAKDQ